MRPATARPPKGREDRPTGHDPAPPAHLQASPSSPASGSGVRIGPRYGSLRGRNLLFVRRLVAVGRGVLVAVTLLGWPSYASAATIRVTNQRNGGPGSLRRALNTAHAGDTILVPRGTYQLTSQLSIPT